MRGSSLSTFMPMRSSSASTLDLPACSDTQYLTLVTDCVRRDVLIGRRVLGDGRGVNAGLGRKGTLTDIGRMAIGAPVEPLIERVRHLRQLVELGAGNADVECIGELRLQFECRNDRHKIGIAATLAEAIERALNHGAHRHAPRRRNSPPPVRCRYGRGCRRDRRGSSAQLRRRSFRFHAAACRHWCRTARPSAHLHHRPPWRKPAHISDWPCSHRKNARNRAALRDPWPLPAFTLSRIEAMFSSLVVSSATRT